MNFTLNLTLRILAGIGLALLLAGLWLLTQNI